MERMGAWSTWVHGAHGCMEHMGAWSAWVHACACMLAVCSSSRPGSWHAKPATCGRLSTRPPPPTPAPSPSTAGPPGASPSRSCSCPPAAARRTPPASGRTTPSPPPRAAAPRRAPRCGAPGGGWRRLGVRARRRVCSVPGLWAGGWSEDSNRRTKPGQKIPVSPLLRTQPTSPKALPSTPNSNRTCTYSLNTCFRSPIAFMAL